MKKVSVSMLMLFVVLGLTSCAAAKKAPSAVQGAKPGAIAVDVIEFTATVKALDPQKRTVTLQGEAGKTLTLNAKNVRNFDQIKVGDKVKAEYVEELAVFVRKADTPPEAEAEQTVALAPKGQMPGGIVAETAEIQANVEDINYEKRTVTLKGAAGGIRTLKVGSQVKNFKEIKKGDQVVLRITEALALKVTKP